MSAAESLSMPGVWSRRLLLVALTLAISLVHLVPGSGGPGSWPGPELAVNFAIAWSIRRPELAPPILVGATILMSDLLLQRPPGLWALLAVMTCEALRGGQFDRGKEPLYEEWVRVTLALAFMFISMRFALALTGVAQPPLRSDLIRFVMTFATYPAVVLATRYVFGIRRPSPEAAIPRGRA